MIYPHLASRVFGVPLLIERQKLDAILSAIGPKIGVTVETVGPGDTGRQRKAYHVTEDKIAVIDVMGPLVKRASGEFMSGGPTTYGEIENEFMDAARDPEIKGILFQIDSPGGETVGAFELSDLIYSQRGSKPIYAVADGDAFSAAYALASAADRLYVAKSGGVGSVGVWMMHVDQSAMNAQKGLKPTYLFAGARKIDGNPHEPLTAEAREVFQGEVDRMYQMFVETVARNRGMKVGAVKKTEAGLYFGQDSVAIGFGDQVGTVTDAMTDLRAAIARPFTSSRVTASAAAPKKGAFMENEKPADAVTASTTGIDVVANVRTMTLLAVDAGTVRAEALAYAAEVIDMCALAGMPALAAGHIRAGHGIEQVRGDLLLARASQDAETEIHSHVLPETSASSGWKAGTVAPEQSAIVKAAERLAAARKEQ